MQAARRAADLTRKMLAYSGKGRFVNTRMDLSELVRENMNLFRTAIPRGVSLNLRLTHEGSTIEADADQVQQVIMNLITNAAEAIGEKGGVITLTTGADTFDAAYLSKSRLDEKPPAGRFAYVEATIRVAGWMRRPISVSSTPFSPPSHRPRFGDGDGSGIVRGHKGAIMVRSEVGHGSTIRVLFRAVERVGPPRWIAAPSGRRAREGTPPPLRTVLVVDDEKDVREVCAAFVQALGFHPLIAEDGRTKG